MTERQMPVTVSALLRQGDSILLVEERERGDPGSTWMLPGGRVARDESPDAALRREVTEETGLQLRRTPVLAFSVEIEAAMDDLRGVWRALTYACEADGSLAPNDPDGLILKAEWVDATEAFGRLEQVEWYDTGPLRAFLAGSGLPGSRYRYQLAGRRGAVARSVVEVLDPGDR